MRRGAARLGVVTSNEGKLREFRALAAEYGVEVYPIVARKPEIQADDVRVIATASAATLMQHIREPFIVEDAGLFIDALNGFPGPYSAYVLRTIGVNGVLKLMEGVRDRSARFVAAIAYANSEVGVRVFAGEVRGAIATEARGVGGFGFDPIFVPEGWSKTFAEVGPEEKSRVSHRGRAFKALMEWLLSERIL